MQCFPLNSKTIEDEIIHDVIYWDFGVQPTTKCIPLFVLYEPLYCYFVTLGISIHNALKNNHSTGGVLSFCVHEIGNSVVIFCWNP